MKMGKIISERLAQPDDPIFTGGVEIFAVRKAQPNPTSKPVVSHAAPHSGMLKELMDEGMTEEQAMIAILDI